MKRRRLQVRTFKDLKGSEWVVRFTVGSAMRIRQELGIDIDRLISGDSEEIGRLLSDTWRIMELLVLLLADQIESRGMVDGNTPSTEFYDRFGGDVLDEACIAILQAIGDSLPKLKRRGLLAVVERISPTMEAAAKRVEEKVREMPIEVDPL
jgi:hypothetical protein